MAPRGLFGRALLALALAVGFYAMALGVVVLCFGLSAAMLTGGGRVPVKVLVLLLAAGGVTLWSIVPRWDRFVAPGPRLLEREHPRLFSVLREVASATGQPMPDDVFLVEDVNAFVANRGGMLGFGSRPIMGIGLPLLQCLTVEEMRAVIGHEFGHYVGGDTQLGPLIYRTRGAIVRTLSNLASAGSILAYPFSAYLRLFLRVSHAVSRQQEFQADMVGAKVGGVEALANSLRKVRVLAPAFLQYWSEEFLPAVACGVRPPAADGFSLYLAAPHVRDAMTAVAGATREVAADPYDTHPPLGERLRAMGAAPSGVVPELTPSECSLSLLGDVSASEAALVQHLLRDDVPAPRAVSWLQTGEMVVVTQWDSLAAREPALGEQTPRSVHSFLRDPGPVLVRLRTVRVPSEPAARAELAQQLALVVLGRAGRSAGFEVESWPGRPVSLLRGAIRFVLPELVAEAASLPEAAWAARCVELGVDPSIPAAGA